MTMRILKWFLLLVGLVLIGYSCLPAILFGVKTVGVSLVDEKGILGCTAKLTNGWYPAYSSGSWLQTVVLGRRLPLEPDVHYLNWRMGVGQRLVTGVVIGKARDYFQEDFRNRPNAFVKIAEHFPGGVWQAPAAGELKQLYLPAYRLIIYTVSIDFVRDITAIECHVLEGKFPHEREVSPISRRL